MLLTDGTSRKRPTVYLGQQPIISAEPAHFAIKSAPVIETLRFPIPSNTKMQRFSEITVMVLADVNHQYQAPKIAIQQFELRMSA